MNTAGKVDVFDYRTPTRWRICFLCASTVLLGMGLTPWYYLLSSENVAGFWAIVVLAGFTVLPLLLGFCLFYFCFRSVQFHCVDKSLFRTLRCFGIARTKRLQLDRISLERAAFGQRNPQLWLAVYGHSQESKSLLANEQTCDSVQGLYRWFEKRRHLACVDTIKSESIDG